jgi:hypothetical protein
MVGLAPLRLGRKASGRDRTEMVLSPIPERLPAPENIPGPRCAERYEAGVKKF